MSFIADGVTVEGREPTEAEIAEREAWAEEAEAEELAKLEAIATAEASRESVQEKLAGWGLTEAEIGAIIPA
jgi:hypothetical protein